MHGSNKLLANDKPVRKLLLGWQKCLIASDDGRRGATKIVVSLGNLVFVYVLHVKCCVGVIVKR